MKRADLKAKVKVKLEEYSPYDEAEDMTAIPTSDIKPLDDYIEENIDSACDQVKLIVPLYLLRDGEVEDDTSTMNSKSNDIKVIDGVLYRSIPDDFLRLKKVMYQDWMRDVSVAIGREHPLYPLQRNKWTRGKNVKPVVAITDRIEIYSVGDEKSNKCEAFYYIPKTKIGCKLFGDTIADMVVLQTAIQVLMCFTESEKAQTLTAELKQLIESQMI